MYICMYRSSSVFPVQGSIPCPNGNISDGTCVGELAYPTGNLVCAVRGGYMLIVTRKDLLLQGS